MEFMAMRMEDPNFRLQYMADEFEYWYADFMEILNQKHGEYQNEN
jgi:hypothetical protein